MSGGAAKPVSSIRRIPQIPRQGVSIVGDAVSDVTEVLRSGGGGDQVSRLGQGSEADDAG